MFKAFIVLAFIIRLLLMPIATHSDLFFINMFPNLFVSQKVVNINTFVQSNFADRNYTYYSPLTYFTFAFFQSTYGLVSKSFSEWMTELFNLELSGFQGQAADFIKATQNPSIYKDLFLAKLPYLLFDIASVIVLLKMIKERISNKMIILVWLFNPVSIYTTYLMGQFDIIPTFFTLIGFFYLKKNHILGLLLLGIAAAFKNYAILFILPIVLIYGDTWKKRLKLLLIGFAPYLIFLIPIILSEISQALYLLIPKAYLQYRKPLEGWALYSQQLKYSILLMSYCGILFLSATLKIKDKYKLALGISLAALLLVYAIAPRLSFHYLIWGTPLVLLYFNKIKSAGMVLLFQAIFLSSYKLLVNHLQAGLFAPISPETFSQIKPINEIINTFIPYYIVSASGFFLFAALNLFLAAKIILNLLFQQKIRLSAMNSHVNPELPSSKMKRN